MDKKSCNTCLLYTSVLRPEAHPVAEGHLHHGLGQAVLHRPGGLHLSSLAQGVEIRPGGLAVLRVTGAKHIDTVSRLLELWGCLLYTSHHHE